MLRVRLTIIAIIIISFTLGATAAQLPVPDFSDSKLDPEVVKQGLSILVTVVGFNAGATILFLLNLNAFQTSFRRVYYLISAGIVVQVLSSLASAVMQYASLWGTDVTLYARDLPFGVIGAGLIFWGVVRFAQILGVTAWKNNFRILIILTIIGLPVLWFSPLQASPYLLEFGPDKALLLKFAHNWEFIQLLFYFFTGRLVWQIRAVAGPRYKRPLLWFGLTFAVYVTGAATYLAVDYMTLPVWFRLEYVALPYFIGYALLISSGYSFASITQESEHRSDASAVDVITYLASLVSKPTEVDPILDELRVITAAQSTATNKNTTERLMGIYAKLEDYLINHERLRAYTRETLRAQLQERFNLPPEFRFVAHRTDQATLA